MTAAALPASLERKLNGLAQHLRRQRLLRGLGLLGLTLAPLAGLALLADVFWQLPSWLRWAALALWLMVGLFTAWRALLGPLLRRLDRAALAAVIEQRHPELGERLSTTVELAGTDELGHGSPQLIALLAQDTAQRASGIDFIQAVPPRAGRQVVIVALVVAMVVLSPALRWPREYAVHAQRFLTPWRNIELPAPYQLAVTPGDHFAALGRPLSFSARLTALKPSVTLPNDSTLVITDAAGHASRQPLSSSENGNFTGRIERISGDFTYRVEAGQAVSPAYRVTAVEPVELSAGSPIITITPPAYARSTTETRTLQGLQDFNGLQHGQAILKIGFRQPAISAVLHWTAADTAKPQERVLELSSDGLSATHTLPLLISGTLQLVLTGQHGIITELPPCKVGVQPDQPPAFLQVSGGDERKTIHPYDRLTVAVRIVDDVAVDEAAVEVSINNGPAVAETIVLHGKGTPEAKGEYVFQLAGKLKEGDEVRYRLRAADNRRLPAAGLGPQVVWHPASDRWRTVTIARRGDSAAQEILVQRDDFQNRLDRIKADLGKDRKALAQLDEEARNRASLSPEQTSLLQELEKDSRKSSAALTTLAGEAVRTPGLEPLAELAQDVADRELRRTEQALQEAAREAHAPDRQKRLATADQELAGALKRLDELKQLNQQVAQALLEQLKLRTLADRQQQLADATQAQPTPDQIKKEQAELAQELRRLAQQSDKLRNALEQARGEEARQLGQRAQELAQGQRDLMEAQRQQGAAGQALPPDKNPAAELVKQQAALAKLAGELARQLAKDQGQKAPAALQGEEAARTAQQASRQLQAGALPQAQQAGQQTAQQLQQLAQQLEKDAAAQKQAQSLAERQEAINKQLESLAKNPDVQRTQQQARQQELERQTDELAKQLAQLAGQMQQAPEAQKALQQAAASGKQAQQAMQQAQKQGQDGKPELAQQAQMQAAEGLDRVAQQAAQAGKQDKPDAQQAQTGQSLQQAQGQMQFAQDQLQQDNSQAARPAMRNAAQQLNRAAEQLTQQSGQTGGNATKSEQGASSQGAPDAGAFAQALKQHKAKNWGELPGELRTKLLQDMRAKYGDDYARIIKLYFEQLADRK
jgi:hypothetical protein